jgi:hypothetical protein
MLQHARYGANRLDYPDDKTTIVAVCGSADAVGDDWFFSDYCLLNAALGGTARREKWLSAVDIHAHVEQNGPLLHGNPKHPPRQVVFDSASTRFYTIVPKEEIAENFMTELSNACQAATKGERIMVILVGRSRVGDGAVDIISRHITRLELESCFVQAAAGVSITVIDTACYSGIWTVPFRKLRNADVAVMASTTSEEDHTKVPISDRETSSSRLRRVLLVSDLVENRLLSSPSSDFEEFALRIKERVAKAKSLLKPPFLLASDTTRKTAASAVLGGDDLSTLFRIESVLSLPKDAYFTALPLGVSNCIMADDGVKNWGCWAKAACHMYKGYYLSTMQRQSTPQEICITRHTNDILAGKLSEIESRRIWHLIAWRAARDAWAQMVVGSFAPDYCRIGDWVEGQMEIPMEQHLELGEELLLHDLSPPTQISEIPYSRPTAYVLEAASVNKLSKAQLRYMLIPPHKQPVVIAGRNSSLQDRSLGSSVGSTPLGGMSLSSWSSLGLVAY